MNDDNFRPVPKPPVKKKKRLFNGYKDKSERSCYYCNTPYAERHEVFGGPNRQVSIGLKFQVDLCPKCHREWHEQKKFKWILRKKEWQQYYQEMYEGKLVSGGLRKDQARECWMSLIGWNYLDD